MLRHHEEPSRGWAWTLSPHHPSVALSLLPTAQRTLLSTRPLSPLPPGHPHLMSTSLPRPQPFSTPTLLLLCLPARPTVPPLSFTTILHQGGMLRESSLLPNNPLLSTDMAMFLARHLPSKLPAFTMPPTICPPLGIWVSSLKI